MNIQDRINDSLLGAVIALRNQGYPTTTSSLQRKFKIGYLRARRLSDEVARLIPEAKGHGFCEKSGHVCTMNYCDENGCQERKRVLVEPAPIVEESQRGLWDSLYDKHMVHNGFYPGAVQDHILSDLKENYIITPRKP